jgi:hypothetical protein
VAKQIEELSNILLITDENTDFLKKLYGTIKNSSVGFRVGMKIIKYY